MYYEEKKCSCTYSTMVELVRSSLYDCRPNIPDDYQIGWDRLMDVSIEQGVLTWVWDGICKLPEEKQPSRAEKVNWGLSAQEWSDAYHRQQEVLDRIIEICHQNSVQVLLLKGFGLSELYPKPELRVCGDIDIYLFGDYEKGNELFSGGNYVFGLGDKHSHFIYEGVTVENHLTFINTNTRQQRLVESYIESTIKDALLSSGGYYILPPLANLVFLIMHALNHMESHISVTIRNLMDIAFFLENNRASIKASNCFDVLHQIKIAKSFELLLSMSEEVSGISFIEFHEYIIPRSDVKKAFDMILNNNSSIDFPLEGTLIAQIRNRLTYYIKMHWKYKYIPFPRYNIIMRIIRPPVSQFLKKIINIAHTSGSHKSN